MQVDNMVREKLAGKEYIILCLEDCADWGHATTRKVVMQVSCWGALWLRDESTVASAYGGPRSRCRQQSIQLHRTPLCLLWLELGLDHKPNYGRVHKTLPGTDCGALRENLKRTHHNILLFCT